MEEDKTVRLYPRELIRDTLYAMFELDPSISNVTIMADKIQKPKVGFGSNEIEYDVKIKFEVVSDL